MAISGTTSGPELLVELDRAGRNRCTASSPTVCGRHSHRAVGARTRMPSTRVLAADLGVSRRLVVDAYSQLVAEGFLLSRHGSGTRVATVDAASASRATPAIRDAFDVDFAPGSPDLSSFPRHAWLRALRQGLAEIESHAFGYVEPQGLPRHAPRSRTICGAPAACSPIRSTSCSARERHRPSRCSPRCYPSQTLAMEDPGFWLHRMVLRHNGIEPIPVPVDDDGLDVAALADSGATTVLATPAHQSPTGVVLSAARRTALVQWARADHLVIEDDYDAEYRYDRAPVGALQGIAPDRVVYVGSTSKTLAPGLRIGWMVLPAHLVGPVTLSKGLADTGSSVMDQIAFAKLLTTGGYDRHLRQMRRRYLTRRNVLLRALARYLPEATVLGAAAGVHLTVRFPDGFPVADLVDQRRNAGAGRTACALLRITRRGAAGSDAGLRQSHRVADRHGRPGAGPGPQIRPGSAGVVGWEMDRGLRCDVRGARR